MNVILKNVTIVNPFADKHLQKTDIHIKDGFVFAVGDNLSDNTATIINEDNLHIAPGLVELHSYLYLPGNENKESYTSFATAALRGGYTKVAVMPHASPVIQTKAQVISLLKEFQDSGVDILPIGAVSKDLEGKELTEIYDMYMGGAIAYSDGQLPTANSGIINRALEYVKAFDGLVLSAAADTHLCKGGQIHEGLKSNRMGLSGIPAIAETIAVNQLIYLLNYTKSRLHILAISLGESCELIKAAKAQQLSLSASVAVLNLLLSEEEITGYDTAYKLMPPLRPAVEFAAIKTALKEGVIDCISSQHNPQDTDSKKTEFDKAAFGAIGFESCFAASVTALRNDFSISEIIQYLSINSRKILKQTMPTFAIGEKADMFLFNPTEKWIFSEKDIFSKSKNSPLLGKELIGKVKGVINNHKFNWHGKN